MEPNKGTGAGGSNTNVSGLAFEQKTSIIPKLEAMGFQKKVLDKTKNGFVLVKDNIYFMTQGGLGKVFNWTEMFRNPDEAFLIIHKDGTQTLKILEKKNQSGAGSVDSKLALGSYFIEEYKEVLNDANITIEYAFCLCNFLKTEYTSDKKKWVTLRTINDRHGIKVFYGDDPDYFETIFEWLTIPNNLI